MRRDLRGAVVVITGASSGIGRASALKLAERGANVVLAARGERALAEVAALCRERGVEAIAVPTDVSDERQVEALARAAEVRFGRVDVWVNNAAVSLFAPFEEAPLADYRRVIETNLFGTVYGARAALKRFREQGTGVLINMSSAVGKGGTPYVSAYVASKFGIIGLSESLRQELLDTDIDVVTVLPASIDTPLFQHAANYTRRAIKPLDPIYSVEKVAEAVAEAARRPRREVYVGAAGRASAGLHKISPALFERMSARVVGANHFQDRASALTSGNLYAPMEDLASESGGWRRGGRHNTAGLATGALALTGLGLAAWWIARSARRPPRRDLPAPRAG